MEGVEKIRHGSNGYAQEELQDFELSFRAYARGAAKAEYERTGDISWVKEWFTNYQKSAELAENIARRHSNGVNAANRNIIKHAAHAYGFAAEAAKVIYEKFMKEILINETQHEESEVPEQIIWAEQWYDCSIKSADLAAKLGGEGRNLAKYCYRDGAKAATILLEFFREPEYARRVIDNTRKHLEFGGPQGDRGRTIRGILQESQRMYMFIKTYGRPVQA